MLPSIMLEKQRFVDAPKGGALEDVVFRALCRGNSKMINNLSMKLAENQAILANIGQYLADLGQYLADLGQYLAKMKLQISEKSSNIVDDFHEIQQYCPIYRAIVSMAS